MGHARGDVGTLRGRRDDLSDASHKLQSRARRQNRIERLRVPLLQAFEEGADVRLFRASQDEGAFGKMGFSGYCFDHGRRDQVKYVTTNLALLSASGAGICADAAGSVAVCPA